MKQYEITVNGKVYHVSVKEIQENEKDAVQVPSSQTMKETMSQPTTQQTVNENGNNITAPMPGTILKVLVTEGQSVRTGEVLCILEAMKMENEIVAPSTGTVSSIQVAPNQAVDSGNLLMVIS